MKVETDEHGQLVARHHDGELYGIMLSDDECRLHYRSSDGVSRIIRLLGIHTLDLSRFREGNVILSMMAYPCQVASNKVPEELLRRLGWGKLPKLKGKYIFVLDSSYGAELVANCDEVDIFVDSEHNS